ncbi:hypothetical protein JKF63_01540 [Porcisia hertigi]|uniref:Uncharacterized protein n=1 Tax=Porcisia hertigi TaxID=2761500 RepID=A0A836HY92_9TRYP|nr:hypothetical protein JKF63_01540 [Porcisia hertigi]
MDKAKTLEVLRGMKFMQRKEEAKRRAAFEVSQREEIERELLQPGLGRSHTNGGANESSSSALLGIRRGGPARATILYDDSFHTHIYQLSRCSFTETLGGGDAIAAVSDQSHKDTSLIDGAVESVYSTRDPTVVPKSATTLPNDSDAASDEEVEDLWGGEDTEDYLNDPTAASGRRRHRGEKTHADRGDGGQHVQQDRRFVVKASVRAPKLPRRLQERIEEEQRQKRKRAE